MTLKESFDLMIESMSFVYHPIKSMIIMIIIYFENTNFVLNLILYMLDANILSNVMTENK